MMTAEPAILQVKAEGAIGGGTTIGRVLGVKVDQSDLNHPEEIYWGKSSLDSLDEMIIDLGVDVYPEDKVIAFPAPDMNLGSVIRIERALPVTVTDGNATFTYRTWKTSVGELLKERDISVGEKDIISPSVDSVLSYNLAISITRVAETEVKQTVAIPFETETRDDPNLEQGKTKVIEPGEKGTREKIYRVRRENGSEVSRELLSDNVVKEPKVKIVAKGTKPKVISKGAYKEIINEAAEKYGVPADGLYKLMICESNGNSYSVGGGGSYFGLFQYTKSAWSRTAYGSYDIFDPWAQIHAAASQWGQRKGLWPSCSGGL